MSPCLSVEARVSILHSYRGREVLCERSSLARYRAGKEAAASGQAGQDGAQAA